MKEKTRTLFVIKKKCNIYQYLINGKGSFVDYWSSLQQLSLNRKVIFSKRNSVVYWSIFIKLVIFYDRLPICLTLRDSFFFSFSFWFFSKTKIVWKLKALYFHISILSQYSSYNIQLWRHQIGDISFILISNLILVSKIEDH